MMTSALSWGMVGKMLMYQESQMWTREGPNISKILTPSFMVLVDDAERWGRAASEPVSVTIQSPPMRYVLRSVITFWHNILTTWELFLRYSTSQWPVKWKGRYEEAFLSEEGKSCPRKDQTVSGSDTVSGFGFAMKIFFLMLWCALWTRVTR